MVPPARPEACASAGRAHGFQRWAAGLVLACAMGQACATDTDTGTALAAPAAWSLTDKRVGVAWLRYREPIMHLQGPALTLQLDWQGTRLGTQRPGWAPDALSAELLLARLHYSSADTGSLSGVPAVGWRVSALWQMPEVAGHAWRLGPQYEGLWNDLRGTTSTGHQGYERLSNKLWLVAQARPAPERLLELGLLVRGWQDSWLSQASSQLPDITNVQKRGLTLHYRHSPWTLQNTALAPWVRYTQIGTSDFVGLQRWYEPRNRTLELGVQASF